MGAVLAAGAMSVRLWQLPEVGARSNRELAADAAAAPTVRDLAALEAQARDEGYAAGHAEGVAAGQQQVREHMAQLDAVLESAARPLQDLDAQTGQELVALAMVVARRVIASELQLSPALILRAVQQAAAALPAATRELRVHVHPDDLALLQESPRADSHWQYLADPTLTRGDCQLESARSRLDARVETRLAAVIDAVLGDDLVAAEVDA